MRICAYCIVVACRAAPSDPSQAVEVLDCERRRISGRCAEESGQAGEEGDWWAGGWRSQAEVTGEKTGNRSKESVTHNAQWKPRRW